jgi:hypothetical protein
MSLDSHQVKNDKRKLCENGAIQFCLDYRFLLAVEVLAFIFAAVRVEVFKLGLVSEHSADFLVMRVLISCADFSACNSASGDCTNPSFLLVLLYALRAEKVPAAPFKCTFSFILLKADRPTRFAPGLGAPSCLR